MTWAMGQEAFESAVCLQAVRNQHTVLSVALPIYLRHKSTRSPRGKEPVMFVVATPIEILSLCLIRKFATSEPCKPMRHLRRIILSYRINLDPSPPLSDTDAFPSRSIRRPCRVSWATSIVSSHPLGKDTVSTVLLASSLYRNLILLSQKVFGKAATQC
jgi:hypothetical protein